MARRKSPTTRIRELNNEVTRLRQTLAALEASNLYAQAIASDAARQFRVVEQELMQERERRHRLAAQLDGQLASLSCLYATAHRMSEARGRSEVLQVISDVLANIVGCERFGVFELLPGAAALELVASMGIEAQRLRRVPLGSGCIGSVAQTGVAWLRGQLAPADSEQALTACFPLKAADRVTGTVALFELLPQKAALDPLDREVFALLEVQAGRALQWTQAVPPDGSRSHA